MNLPLNTRTCGEKLVLFSLVNNMEPCVVSSDGLTVASSSHLCFLFESTSHVVVVVVVHVTFSRLLLF